MSLKLFIQRPILSAVISILIILGGIISLLSLPVEQYPDMAPVTINVTATYPGANAETLINSILSPLEQNINGVEGMTYMTSSTSSTGEANINIYFKSGTNPDLAAINVQNRVSSALPNLPAEVTKYGVIVEKQQNSELMTIGLYSENPIFDENFLNNYMNINVVPRLKRISGVGKVMLFGADYNMRLWLNPYKMASYKLIPSDIEEALAGQNIEAATGSFGENHNNTFVYTMKYRGRLSKIEDFNNIVIRSLPDGNLLRLKDVARVELGSEAYNFTNRLDGHPTALAMIQQTAGSNAYKIINNIDKEIIKIEKQLPEGIKFQKIDDTNHFLKASINVVVRTLFEALILVILVVYIFLQDLRSTFIPSVSIIVSLVGTFAFMHIIGFSINLLTLFALVLAIGTVIDDAIIVVEAVQTNFDKGYHSPYLASIDAMGNIARALLTSTIIFMVVFIPMSFINGTSGTFYREFGLTMAAAVGISALNAFTLSPALCALILRPYMDTQGKQKNNFTARFRRAFNVVFNVMRLKYSNGIMFFLNKKYAAFIIIVIAGGVMIWLINRTPTGIVPDEDTGMLFVNMSTKPGTSLQENAKALKKMEDQLKTIPGISHYAMTNGYSFTSSGSNSGMFFVPLKDWKERTKEESIEKITKKINKIANTIPEAEVIVMSPPIISGFGMSNGFELNLQDYNGGSAEKFQQVKEIFIKNLNKQPEIDMAYSDFSADYPQYWVDVNAVKCIKSGVAPDELLKTVASYYGGSYISNFNRFSRLYNVTMQADPKYRVNTESLNHIFVRLNNGEMAPVSDFMTITATTGPQTLSRFNLFNSINITGSASKGHSNGEAMKAIERVAKQSLPKGYGFEYGGLTLEESQSKGNFHLVFLLSIVIIYMVLAALYESLVLPFAVIITVPVGVLGSFVMAQILNLQNDIYMQTSIVLLIGLLAKTAILITEYAVEHRHNGMTLVMSAYSAAKDRFRPILMTVLSMLLGLMPLMFANGAGANGSRSLASCVIGGMIVGSIAILFLTPTLFVVLEWIQEHYIPKRLIDSKNVKEDNKLKEIL